MYKSKFRNYILYSVAFGNNYLRLVNIYILNPQTTQQFANRTENLKNHSHVSKSCGS